MSALNNQSLKNTLENNLSHKMETGVVNHEAQLLGKAPLAHQNPLDRNGDGKIDSRDLSSNQFNHGGMMVNQGLDNGLLGQTTYVQSTQRASLGLVRSEPVLREVIQKDAVIREHIHPVQKEEIQPIIYREREQLDIKQVTQMMHETQIQPTILEQRELPAERRRDVIERGAPIVPNTILPTSEVMSTTRTQQIHAPIVQETVRKTILEEIQPVLERDVYQSTVIQNTQPIYEKIIEAPRISREVREVGNVDMSRRLSQGYSTMPLTQGVSDVNANFVQGQTFEQAVLQNRRLSQNYDQSVYNETLLTHRGLQNSGSQNLPLSQGQGYASTQAYVQPTQSNRLSQNMSEPLYQNRRLSQNMSQQPFGVNVGQAPMAGMNNTSIGMASAVPLNTAAPMMSNGMARGYNEQSGIYNAGFAANNMVTSVGLNGTHSVAGSVNSTVGNNLPRAPVMTPVSVMEQSLPSYRTYSDSSFGLQASPAYQNSLQGEKMRELEREQMLRQQNPQMYNAM